MHWFIIDIAVYLYPATFSSFENMLTHYFCLSFLLKAPIREEQSAKNSDSSVFELRCSCLIGDLTLARVVVNHKSDSQMVMAVEDLVFRNNNSNVSFITS